MNEPKRFKSRGRHEVLRLTEQVENKLICPDHMDEVDWKAYKVNFIKNVFKSALLTEHQSQVLSLYYFEGLTQREIAERLSINQSSVNRCLKGALAKIRKFYVEGLEYATVSR